VWPASDIGYPHSDRHGWCSYARPIRAAASTIIIFSLMSNRKDSYLGLLVDIKEGHVSCGPEWDHKLTRPAPARAAEASCDVEMLKARTCAP
jgi:hypothetical protein